MWIREDVQQLPGVAVSGRTRATNTQIENRFRKPFGEEEKTQVGIKKLTVDET